MCLNVGDSCPEYTGDLEMELKDYNSESEELYGAEVQNQANTNKTFPSISDAVSTAAATTIGKVLYQVNVASTAYAFYSLFGLFFPAPLLMFRLPFEFYIKRYLFGIHKPTFILFVVALWWGIEYFKPFWMNPEIQLYLRMLRIGDPCLFDSDFIKAKVSVIKDICEELMTMKRPIRYEYIGNQSSQCWSGVLCQFLQLHVPKPKPCSLSDASVYLPCAS